MLRRILIGVAALVAVAAVAAGVVLWVTRPPDPGPFYEPPAGAGAAAPGALLRSEPFTAGIPDGAEAWRILAVDLSDDPRWRARVAENTPSGRIDAPVMVVQGRQDGIIDPAIQRRWVERRCAAGQAIDLRWHPRGHLDVMDTAGPAFVAWTRRLMAGEPVPQGCRTG